MTNFGFSKQRIASLFAQIAAFAFVELATEALFNENVQTLLQRNNVYILNYLAGKGVHQ